MDPIWNAELECRIGTIDEDHKLLLSLMNELIACTGIGSFVNCLDKLLEKIPSHCSEEESAHADAKFPSALSHKQAHWMLLTSLRQTRLEIRESAPDAQKAVRMRHNIARWLRNHFMAHDMVFVRFIREQA